MNFLLDAQLPRRAAAWFTAAGCDAVHTFDLYQLLGSSVKNGWGLVSTVRLLTYPINGGGPSRRHERDRVQLP